MIKRLLLNKNQLAKLVVRHLVVSATCATIDFSSFGFAVYYLNTSITLAYALAFSIATLVGFFGHTYFTYEVGRLHLKNALLFVLQATTSFLIGYFLLMLLLGLGLPVMLSKLIQLGLVFFFNVSIGKFLTFKKRGIDQ